jgi:hypothetical protein
VKILGTKLAHCSGEIMTNQFTQLLIYWVNHQIEGTATTSQQLKEQSKLNAGQADAEALILISGDSNRIV